MGKDSESDSIAERRRALGARLALRRKARGLTQHQVARATRYERTAISHIERGERRLDERFWRTVDDLLEAGGALLDEYRKVCAAEREQKVREQQRRLAELIENADNWRPNDGFPVTNSEVPWDPMRRRTLMKWGLATSAAGALTGLGGDTAGKVGANDVDRVRQAMARLFLQDQQHGGDPLWQAAAAQADHGSVMLEHGTYTEAVGRQLLKTVGQFKVRAGWLAFDAGHHDIARDCYTDALILARQCSNHEVEAHALKNLAFQSSRLGMPREALRCAQAAERVSLSSDCPPELAVTAQLERARAHALLSDARSSDRAIISARDTLEHLDGKYSDQWFTFLSQAEIDAFEASCSLSLGRASRAETLTERCISGYDSTFARNIAMNRVRLARARLDADAVDGAVEAADAALDQLAGARIASWRVRNDLADVARGLAAHPKTPGVDQFLNRYSVLSKE